MFNTIQEETNSKIEIKKSVFIGNIFKVNSETEAKKKIEEISKKYYDAKHNCYAYRILKYDTSDNKKEKNECNYIETQIERLSDNGEPSGTAGSPILDVIRKRDLNNILVVVTRYFGGTLLGTGGLVRAYTDATVGALEKSNIIKKEIGIKYTIEAPYSETKNILYICKKFNINIVKNEYNFNIILTIESNYESKLKLTKEIENTMKTNVKISTIEDNILILCKPNS